MYFMDYVDEEKEYAKEEGALENAVSNAKKMLLNGKLTENEIADITSLSLEKVQELAKEVTVSVEK